jgi:hypothetical protein
MMGVGVGVGVDVAVGTGVEVAVGVPVGDGLGVTVGGGVLVSTVGQGKVALGESEGAGVTAAGDRLCPNVKTKPITSANNANATTRTRVAVEVPLIVFSYPLHANRRVSATGPKIHIQTYSNLESIETRQSAKSSVER